MNALKAEARTGGADARASASHFEGGRGRHKMSARPSGQAERNVAAATAATADTAASALAQGPAEPPSEASPSAGREPPKGMPGLDRQKAFIVENAFLLNLETKKSILRIVMMEVGDSVLIDVGRREVDVDLDGLASLNPEVLGHIYNIIRARLALLNQPARPPAGRLTAASGL